MRVKWSSAKVPDVIVDLVHFFARLEHVQQLGGDALLGRQNHAVLCQNADRRAGVRNGLHRVLDLVQSPLGREGRGARIVAARLPRSRRVGPKGQNEGSRLWSSSDLFV